VRFDANLESAMKRSLTTKIALFLLQNIPLSVRKFLFVNLAVLVYYLVPGRRLIALYNLTRAFPEKSENELTRIAKGVYRNFGILLAEFVDIPHLNAEKINDLMEIKGMENYVKARAKNKGVIILTAHFGNWELLAAAFAVIAKPVTVLHRPLDNSALENIVSWVRSSTGNRFIPAKRAMRGMLRCLGEKGNLGLLIDQNWSRKESCFVEFFKRPACTSSGLAHLVLITGAPVLPAFLIRNEEGKYVMQIGAELEIIETGNMDSDVVANTQRFASVIEEVIRQHPEQWFWVHQRWKTKPFQLRLRQAEALGEKPKQRQEKS